MKKISVIVPIYNVQDYVKECVESICLQSYSDLEILLVDDGSTDGSMDVLQGIITSDSRIRVVHKANGGLSDARNYGIQQATGDCYAFIDGDDRIHIDMMKLLTKSMEENQSQIAVCDMTYFEQGKPNQESSGGEFACTSVQETPSLIRINNSACNKLFSKELFKQQQFPVGKYYEDLALIPILLYQASSVSKVDCPLYEYRQRSGSIAHSASKKIFDIYDAIDGVVQYIQAHGNQSEVLEEVKHLYITHGLDLTTLRIKDFDDKEIREQYLQENMEHLKVSYPTYQQDQFVKKAGIRKKLIFSLLAKGKYKTVLKLYDRK